MKKISIAVFYLLFLLSANTQGIQLKKGMTFNYRLSSFEESIKYYGGSQRDWQDEECVREQFQLKVIECNKDYYLIKAIRTQIDNYRRYKAAEDNQWESVTWYNRELLIDTTGKIKPFHGGRIKYSDSVLFKLTISGEIIDIRDLDTITYFQNSSYSKKEIESQIKKHNKEYLLNYFFSIPQKLTVGKEFKQDTILYKVLDKTTDYWLLAKLPVEGQKIESTVKVDASTGMLIESYNDEHIEKNVETTRTSYLDPNGKKVNYKLKADKITRTNIVKTDVSPYKCIYEFDGKRKDTIFCETNVTIMGSIKNLSNIHEIGLYWYETSIVNNLRNYVITNINNQNQFELRLKVNDMQKVFLTYQDKEVKFFVLPGDNVTLEFDYNNFNESLHCQGIGSNSINYVFESQYFDKNGNFDLGKIRMSSSNLQFKLNAQEYEKHFQDAFNKKFDYLRSWKGKIAPELFLSEYCQYQIELINIIKHYYGNQKITSKKMVIQPSGDTTYSVEYSADESKRLDVQKYFHPDNALMAYYDLYRQFLYRYTFPDLQNKITMFTGVRRFYLPDEKNRTNYELNARYDFCHTYYSGKNAYLLKYQVVTDAFKRGNWETCEQLYIRFISEYPYSAYAKFLTNDYKRIKKNTPGQIMYDFEFEGLYGEKVKISDFRGKAVYLVFFNDVPQFTMLNRSIETYGNQLYEKVQDKNVAVVYVSMSDNLEQTKAYFEKTGLKGIKLIAKDKAEAIRNMFFFGMGNYTIILDIDGKIVYKETPDINSIIQDPELLLKACKPLFRNESSQTVFILLVISASLLLLVLIAVLIIFINKRRAAQRIKLANLNTRVRELELTAIRAQMNPHFLYNCLNSIQNLVQKNQTEQAHLYLSKFASLIRLTLKKSDKEEASLAEELELITQYVELEQLRFDIDFTINIEKGIDPFSVYIPPLLLQPLVENSIIHGLSHKTGHRKLIIDVKREHGQIRIAVEDNGIGREASGGIEKVSTGKGIGFTKERLDLIAEKYGTQYQFNIYDLNNAIEQVEEKGTKVEICFVED